MIRSRRLPSTAMVGLLVLSLIACSPSTSSPAQTSPGVPTATQPTPTAASVTPSPTAASSTARRSPAPLRTVRQADLVVRIDTLGELCCPSPAVVVTVDGRLVTKGRRRHARRAQARRRRSTAATGRGARHRPLRWRSGDRARPRAWSDSGSARDQRAHIPNVERDAYGDRVVARRGAG